MPHAADARVGFPEGVLRGQRSAGGAARGGWSSREGGHEWRGSSGREMLKFNSAAELFIGLAVEALPQVARWAVPEGQIKKGKKCASTSLLHAKRDVVQAAEMQGSKESKLILL